jgi:hypothetical protein
MTVAAGLMIVAAVLGMTGRSRRNASAQEKSGASQAPMFEVDPLWPKPLPNHWVLGSIGGIGIDEQDHVWILNRGSRTLAANFKQLEMTPPWAMCCASAPAVLEFVQASSGWTRNMGSPSITRGTCGSAAAAAATRTC